MTQNLNHYEKILSRSHSNYLAQISIDMTTANNETNDVLSRMTALGTILMYVPVSPPFQPERADLADEGGC
jgi:magnesium transporter